jgi:hypothetical protein
MSDFDIETVLDAAQRHGRDDDPDHEIGDLQDAFRAAWKLMSEAERTEFAGSDAVTGLLELTDEEHLADTVEGLEEVLVKKAKQHADDTGEFDHEAGDLQDMLRDAWKVMSPATRAAFAADATVLHNIAVANVDVVATNGPRR